MGKRVTRELLASLELIVSDVDGVLTDGKLYLGEDGREWKAFHVRDGQAVALGREAGLAFALLTGRSSHAVERRARELEIREFVQGSSDKGIDFLEICQRQGVVADHAAMIGDDLADLSAFYHAGLSVAPADGAEEVRDAADLVTRADGGRGVLRELVEMLLDARGVRTKKLRHRSKT